MSEPKNNPADGEPQPVRGEKDEGGQTGDSPGISDSGKSEHPGAQLAMIFSLLSAAITIVLGILTIAANGFSVGGKLVLVTLCITITLGLVLWWRFFESRRHAGVTDAKSISRGLVAYTVITVIMFLGFLLSLFAPGPAYLYARGKATGYIATPREGQVVPSRIDVSGRAQLKGALSLWVLIEPPNNRLYTTRGTPAIVDKLGRWGVSGVGVGTKDKSSEGRPYVLHLIAVPQHDDPIQRKIDLELGHGLSVNFDKLPDQAEELDVVTITRRRT